jgi:hypothetical protein
MLEISMEQVAPGFAEGLIETKEDRQDELLELANVVGVGLGHKWSKGQDTGTNCVQVFVEHKVDTDLLPSKDRVPKTLNRRPTDVVAVGTLFAGGAIQAGPQSLKNRRRPAMGGDSVGHFDITAGTAGTGCYDAKDFPGIPSRYYILSNNHVLANSNDASVGDAIYQPGPFDGGTAADTIGRLARFVPIKFDGSNNLVDAAIAEVEFHDFTREIYYQGYVQGNAAPVAINDVVKKTGRTTSFTTGKVISVNATVNVNYGGGKLGRFTKQIVTSDMSTGGDSGSLILDLEGNAIGLLFAGSATVTIINNISYVQSLLGIRLAEK